MKRSEALKLIHSKLWGTPYSREWESQILECIEEIGMLPPWSEKDKVCFCSSYSDCPGCAEKAYTPKWEPEDETK